MTMRPHVSSVSLQGRTFNLLSSGPEQGELVLLLHGFPEFADSWSGVIRRLAEAEHHAVAFDQRGYSPGARPSQVADYDVSQLTADVLEIADELGARRFHLVGHDWGGLLAWKLAAEHPARLLSLTVLSTPHPDAFGDAIASDADQQAKSHYIQLFRTPGHIAETMLLADDAALLRRVYQGKVAEEQVEENVRRLSEPDALTAALNWYRALRPGARIGKVHVPTLYVWGDQDMALGRVAAEATVKYIEGPYRFLALEGSCHWLLEENPEKIAELLLGHIRSTEPG